MIRSTFTAPLLEPITLAQAKLHLRVDADDENVLIQSLIETARAEVESFTGRHLMRQTIDVSFDEFDEPMRLGAHLHAVDSVTYVDVAGATQTLASTEYVVVAPTHQPSPVGFIHLAYSKAWPTPRAQPNAVTVRAQFGHAEASAVPAPLRSALLLLIGDLYSNREARSDAIMASNPTLQRLLYPWVVAWF